MMRTATFIAAAVALLGAGAFALPPAPQGTQQPGAARMGRDMEDANLPWDRWQPKRLPALPSGVTLDMIRQGDEIYRGKGGCVTCHGPDGFGMPNAGSGVTLGLGFIPGDIRSIDSLVTAGIPEALTRSSVAMPPRGATQNLTPDETRRVAAYVWAVSRVAGEPWPGGHQTHQQGATTAQGDTGGARKTP
jgi:mono/diheme cytochrome c family protein